MTTTLEIGGSVDFTGHSIQPVFPTVTNLRTLAFFGSVGDSSNRVQSGLPIVIASGAPAYDTNQVNLGVQSGRNDVLDTQNLRDIANPCTWAAVIRISHVTPGVGARGQVFGDFRTAGGGIAASWQLLVTGQSQLDLAPGSIIRGSITQLISPITNYHFVAMSYTGGAAGTFTAYDFTENPATGVPLVWATTGTTFSNGGQTLHFGNLPGENLASTPIEHAFAFDAHSLLDVPTLAQLYQWTKANLSRRTPTIII